MNARMFPLPVHFLLLVLFSCAMMGVWMAPVLLAGMPSDIPPLLVVRNFAETGIFSMADALGRFLAPLMLEALGVPSAEGNRVSVFLFAKLARFIPFTNLVGWTFLTAAVFALTLLPWWLAVYKRFNARIAWISMVLYALMPIYWREALWLNHYQFAFFFLFCAFAAFVWLRENHPWLAFALAGIFFGLAAGAKDAFLVFTPWLLGMFLWKEREHMKRELLGVAVFAVFAGAMYVLPYVGDIARYGYPVNQNLARVFPGAKNIQEEFYLHLYPDPYTYLEDRERYDQELLERVQTMSPIERLQVQKILINFNVGEPGFLAVLGNGLWLLLGSIPAYFQKESIGGFFLWLFILPGIVFLWRRDRMLTSALLGLVLSTEVLIRLVLHYARDHVMDTAWALALLASLGIVSVSSALAREWKRPGASLLSLLIVAFLALQFLQVNRTVQARNFARTLVPDTVAAADILRAVPEDSVVALPLAPTRLEQLAVLSDRSLVLFAPATLERLLQERKLAEVFQRYGVTHVMRYDLGLMKRLRQAIPDLVFLEDIPVGPTRPQVTPFLRFLLHVVR